MLNATVAEWILSLVTLRDRAASIVGDLLEEIHARGILFMWLGVLRTAFSFVWRDLAASPLTMGRLAVWGVLANWIIGASFMMLVSISFRESRGSDIEVPSHWALSAAFVLVTTLFPFLVGGEVARRSNGREIAAAVSMVILSAAIYTASGMEHAFASFSGQALCLLAGAVRFRWRAWLVSDQPQQKQ
jgi:hypothetical protein